MRRIQKVGLKTISRADADKIRNSQAPQQLGEQSSSMRKGADDSGKVLHLQYSGRNDEA
jgi:hypothetical protein